MLADFGMCADVVVRTDSSSGLAVGSRRGLGRLRQIQDSLTCGCSSEYRKGDLRLKKEPRDTKVTKTSGRTTHDEPVDGDGLRVQRRADIVGARGAMTIEIVFSHVKFSPGILESEKVSDTTLNCFYRVCEGVREC